MSTLRFMYTCRLWFSQCLNTHLLCSLKNHALLVPKPSSIYKATRVSHCDKGRIICSLFCMGIWGQAASMFTLVRIFMAENAKTWPIVDGPYPGTQDCILRHRPLSLYLLSTYINGVRDDAFASFLTLPGQSSRSTCYRIMPSFLPVQPRRALGCPTI